MTKSGHSGKNQDQRPTRLHRQNVKRPVRHHHIDRLKTHRALGQRTAHTACASDVEPKGAAPRTALDAREVQRVGEVA